MPELKEGDLRQVRGALEPGFVGEGGGGGGDSVLYAKMCWLKSPEPLEDET